MNPAIQRRSRFPACQISDVSRGTACTPDFLPKNIESEYAYPMPAMNPTPESFEIEVTSFEAGEPENETYVIFARVQGTYDVRRFLDDNGVDEKRIACAIAELGRSKRVKVKKQRQ